ncbi:MAG TPA: tetratricopeptide repeat protein [Thermoanaerobaculia bacterium]|jgi:TolA-binding protein
MPRFLAAVLLAAIAALATTAVAAPPSTCQLDGPYEQALCAYQKREFARAETGFRAIVDAGVAEPQTLRSMYFLARTLMKTGRYDDAATLLIRIYSLDKAFYNSWSCDFLLGECRRATGKG